MIEKPDVIAVELVPHREEWADMALAEASRLADTLPKIVLTVHHVGSTAIPGIMAKPIVDLLPMVSDLDALDAQAPDVMAMGYKWHGEFGLDGRRFCTWAHPDTGKRTFQLHFFEAENANTRRMLAFRDYLRTHPKIARDYEAEKLRAASAEPHDTTAYSAEKNDWIKHTEKYAIRWWNSTHKDGEPV